MKSDIFPDFLNAETGIPQHLQRSGYFQMIDIHQKRRSGFFAEYAAEIIFGKIHLLCGTTQRDGGVILREVYKQIVPTLLLCAGMTAISLHEKKDQMKIISNRILGQIPFLPAFRMQKREQ